MTASDPKQTPLSHPDEIRSDSLWKVSMERFGAVAKAHGCDDDKARFGAILGKLAKAAK